MRIQILVIICALGFMRSSIFGGTTTVINGTVSNAPSTFYIGGYGSANNTLIITNGGILNAGLSAVGGGTGASGNVGIVTGTNSTWKTAAWMYLGQDAGNCTVTVEQGGVLGLNWGVILGSLPASSGNTLKVVNGGKVTGGLIEARRWSVLLSNAAIEVSQLVASGNGSAFSFISGSLTTTNGVTVSNNPLPFVIGTIPNATSKWDILGGENRMDSLGGVVLGGASASQTTLKLSGLDTTLRSAGPLFLGNNGISAGSAAIQIEAGSILEANTIVCAQDGSGTITNSAGVLQFTSSQPVLTDAWGRIRSIDGTVSFRNVTDAPVFAAQGSLSNLTSIGTRTLRLSNATNATTTDISIGAGSSTNYNRLELLGGNVTLRGTNLIIGPFGTMLISNCVPTVLADGGALKVMENSRLVYAGDRTNFNPSVSNLSIEVSGTNASWYNVAHIALGSGAGNNRLLITNGGSMFTTNNTGAPYFEGYAFYLGYNSSSCGNSVTVSGEGSVWNNGEVDIGVDGSGNRVDIRDGAHAVVNCVIGKNSGSNNSLSVTGTGTILTGSALVGDSGSYNRLTIADGANASLGGLRIGYSYGATGNVASIQSATLNVDTIDIGFYGYGDLLLDRANLTVNWLYQRKGKFEFPSGIVNVRYSEAGLTVGDGTQPARLNLLGSFHHSSITISSNASLTGLAAYVTTGYGLGAIMGNVVNYGTISPGSPVGEMNILYAGLDLKPSSTVVFNLQGTNQGITYSDLLVWGSARLDGILKVRLMNNFQPAPADVFTVMNWGSVTGAFANVVSGARLKTTDNLGSFRVIYTNSSLTLSDYQSADADGDGIEDAWASAFFGHAPLSAEEKQKDSDGDGQCDYAEFLAGTNPTNSTSVFRITDLNLAAEGKVTLNFVGSKQAGYRVGYSDDAIHWQWIETPLLRWTLPDHAAWEDDGLETGTPPANSRFYQIAVVP